ncbi:MAG: hypothetical protein VX481_04035 [Cyanobacteriota bacterium]|nr:hypothetical protein [Cyanobacteriota bacterium]
MYLLLNGSAHCLALERRAFHHDVALFHDNRCVCLDGLSSPAPPDWLVLPSLDAAPRPRELDRVLLLMPW